MVYGVLIHEDDQSIAYQQNNKAYLIIAIKCPNPWQQYWV